MSQIDYYKVLGVTKSSTSVEIKKAYRKLALKYHPDKNQGDTTAESKFKEAAEAYEILGNSEKRVRYDTYGHSNNNFARGSASSPGFDFGGNSSMEDLFGDFFNRSHQNGQYRQRTKKGRNLRIKLGITIEEMITGVHKRVSIRRRSKCKDCNGSGAKSGTQRHVCHNCGGSGRVVMQQVTHMGVIRQEVACKSCNGEGSTVREPCVTCFGKGIKDNHQEEVDINIPKGSRSNMPFAIKGKGEFIRGGESGDLLVEIFEKEHEKLTIEGHNLILDKYITIEEAIFGKKDLEINTPHGKIKINIPPNSKVGKGLRVSGKGIPVYNSSQIGDLIVYINVEIPDSHEVDEDVKSALSKLSMKKNSNKKGLYKYFREHFIR
tara:strand:- start:498 stop:1628 length:1131 start_codon:yes stop_codon:yes gene_type:complete